jgi:hypothetical protein
MNFKKIFSLAFASALLFTTSCSSDSSYEVEVPKGKYEDGILIANEGNFGTPNADVTFASMDLSSVVQQIYKTNNNNENLGDVLQHVGFYSNYAFLVLNNSNKVKVVNRTDFKKVAEITEQLNQPRYITFSNGKILITNDTKYVNVYDANNLAFVKRLNLTVTSERIVSAGSNVFVQNSAWGSGNKITYINGSDATVNSQITLPNGQIQKIISDGTFVYAITSDFSLADSYIYQLNSTGGIVKTTTLTGIAKANNLCIDNGKFYFTSGMKIYGMGMTSSTIPTTPIVTAVESAPYSGLYGFEVMGGRIFTSDAQGFTADSKITVYDAANGNTIKVISAGRGANGFYKN